MTIPGPGCSTPANAAKGTRRRASLCAMPAVPGGKRAISGQSVGIDRRRRRPVVVSPTRAVHSLDTRMSNCCEIDRHTTPMGGPSFGSTLACRLQISLRGRRWDVRSSEASHEARRAMLWGTRQRYLTGAKGPLAHGPAQRVWPSPLSVSCRFSIRCDRRCRAGPWRKRNPSRAPCRRTDSVGPDDVGRGVAGSCGRCHRPTCSGGGC